MIFRLLDYFVTMFENIVNFIFATFIFTKVKPARINDQSYSLKPLVGPVLKGTPLRILVCILKLPFIGSCLINQLAKDNNFDDIISFAAATPLAEPMPVPPKVCPPDEHDLAASCNGDASVFAENLYSLQASDKNFFNLDSTDLSENKSIIRRLHTLFLEKKLTPLEYVQRCLTNIRSSNASLRSFIHIEDEQQILKEATESTSRFENGSPHSILDGIPVGVKCCIPVRGFRNTIGSRLLDEPTDAFVTAENEAETVRRLRAAKAIIIGLNNMHELGVGGTGANDFYGSAKNPHSESLSRQSGGSSSGGAVAVASGLIPVAVGTCGGGSGRGPKGFCGVVGFKAGYQVCPTKAGLAYSVYHETPACCTVEDCRIVFEILAQQSLVVPRRTVSKPLRVGIFRDHANDASPEMRQAYLRAEEKFRALRGDYEIVDITIPNLHHASIGLNVAIITEIAGGLNYKRHLIGQKVDPAHQIMLLLASSLSASHVLAAQIARRWFVETAMPQIFSKCDVILSPGTGTVAPPVVPEPYGEINMSQTSNFVRFLFFANYVGAPAITLSNGFAADSVNNKIGQEEKLPTSIHLMSNYGNEDILLEAAKVVEHGNPKLMRPQTKWNYFPEYL